MSNVSIEAAKWWAQRACGLARHDNGDRGMTSLFAGMLADTMSKTVDIDRLEKFTQELAERIESELDIRQVRYVSLDCDYAPCDILSSAAKACDIPLANFPWKTNMHVDDDRKEIHVSEGYGAPWELIYKE